MEYKLGLLFNAPNLVLRVTGKGGARFFGVGVGGSGIKNVQLIFLRGKKKKCLHDFLVRGFVAKMLYKLNQVNFRKKSDSLNMLMLFGMPSKIR